MESTKKTKSFISTEVKLLLLLFVFTLIIYGYLGYIKSTNPIDWSNPKKASDFKLGIDKDKHEDFSVQYNVKKDCNVFGKGNIEFFYINTKINFTLSKPTQLINQIMFKHKVMIIKSIVKSFSLTVKINKNEYDFYLLDEQKYASNYILINANFYFGSKIKAIPESSLTPATPRVPWTSIVPANTKEQNIVPSITTPWKPLLPANTKEQNIVPPLFPYPFNRQEQQQISNNAENAFTNEKYSRPWYNKNLSFYIFLIGGDNNFCWKNKVDSPISTILNGSYFTLNCENNNIDWLHLFLAYTTRGSAFTKPNGYIDLFFKIDPKNMKLYTIDNFQNNLANILKTGKNDHVLPH